MIKPFGVAQTAARGIYVNELKPDPLMPIGLTIQ